MRFTRAQAPLLLLLVCSNALAQDDEAVTSAYESAAQGLKAFEQGQSTEALDKFSRAYNVVKLPSLAVYMARAHVKLGHFMMAAALYAEASQLPDGLGDHDVQQAAREGALREREALLARMPRLVVQTPGIPIQSVVIQVDGSPVPSTAVAEGWLLDPGPHRVTAFVGNQKLERDALVSEGLVATVVIQFQTEPAPNTRKILPQQANNPTALPGSITMRNATWVSFGIGGGALVFGGVAALVATEEKPARWSCTQDSDTYCKWRTLSIIGVYSGLVGIATGTVLLLATPNKQSGHQSATRLTPWLGAGSAGVAGQF